MKDCLYCLCNVYDKEGLACDLCEGCYDVFTSVLMKMWTLAELYNIKGSCFVSLTKQAILYPVTVRLAWGAVLFAAESTMATHQTHSLFTVQSS